MSFVDPQTVQNPTTNLFATDGWGDSINAAFNWLRNPKVGCRVTSVVGTAIGTDTVMPWATETFDVGACHDNVTNNSRITIPSGKGGLWFVGCNFAADGTTSSNHVWVVRNATTKLVGMDTHPNSGSSTAACSLETIFVMAAGDYFEVWVTGGGTRSTTVTSSFYAWWLHSGV